MSRVDFPDSPSNGATVIANGITYIYNAAKGVWRDNATAGIASDNPPANPVEGQMWFNSTEAALYFYYNDGSSAQWVSVSGPAGPYGPPGQVHMGISSPAAPASGEMWYDTETNDFSLYYEDGTSNQWITVSGPKGDDGADATLSSIGESIIPDTDSAYDLGSPTNKFRSLYLSSDTLYLGDSASISAGSGGEIILPSLKIGTGANAVKLSANASGEFQTQSVVGGTTQAVKPAGGTVQVADLAAMQAIANPTIGDMVSVVSNKTIYMYNGTGFYKIAVMVNESPTAITGVDGSYQLETDGTATTITAISSDPEGRPLTWSYAVSSGALNGTTVAQTNNVFTITPHASDAATFSITFSVTDGINGAVNAVSAFTLAFVIPNSRYTALSVKATATGSNQTFDDASTLNHTITTDGDVAASTFSPYRQGGFSLGLDGTNDYLQVSQTTDLDLTGDFTVECWAYFNDTAGGSGLMGKWGGSGLFGWNLYATATDFWFYTGNSGAPATQGAFTFGAPVVNQWYHLAVSRTGSTISTYVNGTRTTTITDSNNCTANTTLIVGSDGSSLSAWSVDGYMRDVRIVNGTGLYTGTSFAVPTEPLTAITNTKFLLGNLPYFKDQSTSNRAITVGGNASLKPFSLFDITAPYSKADHGASVHFGEANGNGIIIPTSAATTSGDYTIEFWIRYNTNKSGSQTLTGVYGQHRIVYSGGRFIDWTSGGTQTYWQTGAGTLYQKEEPGTWTHFAQTRTSGVVKAWINGEGSANTVTDNTSWTTSRFGSEYNSSSENFEGDMADIRITHSAIYSSDFTPPTAPLTAITNTKFLLNPETSISDLSQSSAITCVADAATSTTQVKFAGTKSIYLDGTGDFLQSSESVNIAGDWTIEGWYYFTTLTGAHSFFTIGDSASQANSMEFLIHTTGELRFYNMGGGYSNQHTPPSDFLANNWIHIAVVRSGTGTNNIKAYINGTQSGTGHTSNNDLIGKVNIGTELYNGAGTWFTQGYIQDFRVSSIARYTANFTPPTAELQG